MSGALDWPRECGVGRVRAYLFGLARGRLLDGDDLHADLAAVSDERFDSVVHGALQVYALSSSSSRSRSAIQASQPFILAHLEDGFKLGQWVGIRRVADRQRQMVGWTWDTRGS